MNERLWAHFTKRPGFHRPFTGTRNMTVGLWFSVGNLILKTMFTEIFQNMSCNRNELKQSKNTVWKTQISKCTGVRNLIYTQSCTFQVPIAVAATPILFNCSTWSLIMTLRASQITMIMETAPAFPFIGDITRGKSGPI